MDKDGGTSGISWQWLCGIMDGNKSNSSRIIIATDDIIAGGLCAGARS